MRRYLSFILVIILFLSCSGCFWRGDHDRRGYDDRDHRSHDGYRHDDRRSHDGYR